MLLHGQAGPGAHLCEARMNLVLSRRRVGRSKGIRIISTSTIPFAEKSKQNTISNAGIEYGSISTMNAARKITVEVPEKLLEQAQEASGKGITQTVRTGLQLVAASRSYARLRELRGKVKFSRTKKELRDDR